MKISHTFVVVPDADLEKLAETEYVGDREDIDLVVFERFPVCCWVLEMNVAGVAVLAEHNHVDVSIRTGTINVTRLDGDLVGSCY